MKRKIGFMASLDFLKRLPEEVTKILSDIGYEAVSWPLVWFDPQYKNDDERKRLILAVSERNMVVSEWVVQLDYVSLQKEIREMRIAKTIEVIRALGILKTTAPVNLFSGPAPWDSRAPKLYQDISEGTAWQMVLEAFHKVLGSAESEGIIVAVEPVFGHVVRDYYTIMELFRQLDSKNLKVNFDPSHGILVGNDTGWVIRELKDKIVHCHLKDAVGKPGGLPGDTFQFPMLGEGQVPWNEFIQALDDINYKGALTVEYEAFRYYNNVLHNNPTLASKQAYIDVKNLGM